MEDCARSSDIILYKQKFAHFNAIDISFAKFLQQFSELQNQVDLLKSENCDLTRENEALRNHFTFWYIQSSIDSRKDLGSNLYGNGNTKPFPQSRNKISLTVTQTQTREVEVQTQGQEHSSECSRDANYIVRIEIVHKPCLQEAAESPDVIKIIDVGSPNLLHTLKSRPRKTIRPESTLEVSTTAEHVSDETDSERSAPDRNNNAQTVTMKSSSEITILEVRTRPPPPTHIGKYRAERSNPNSTNTQVNCEPRSNSGLTEVGSVQVCQKRKKKTLKQMFSRSRLPSTTKPPETVPALARKQYQRSWSIGRGKSGTVNHDEAENNQNHTNHDECCGHVKGLGSGRASAEYSKILQPGFQQTAPVPGTSGVKHTSKPSSKPQCQSMDAKFDRGSIYRN